MTEQEFVTKIESIKGKAYLVGGAVRDLVLGRKPKDRDYVITGVSKDDFELKFNNPERVGNSFPVYLIGIDKELCEVAFARRERKHGIGYKGFKVEFTPDISIEEDLFRRDTTMNSMALQLPERILIDPFNGKKDIQNKIIKATSEHFVEDPVRALRVARQACQLGFSINEITYDYMNKCKEELIKEPSERYFKELEKALKSDRPSLFFKYLNKANLLEVVYPEIYNLVGKTHSEVHHPEGDAFNHSMEILDFVSKYSDNIITRFLALVHDIGKGVTPLELLPHHYKHEQKGLEVLDNWNKRMTLPVKWIKSAKWIIKNHMKFPVMKRKGKIVELLIEASKLPIDLEEISLILFADRTNSGRRDSELPVYLQSGYIRDLVDELKLVKCENIPDNLSGKQIGEWLLNKRVKVFEEWLDKF